MPFLSRVYINAPKWSVRYTSSLRQENFRNRDSPFTFHTKRWQKQRLIFHLNLRVLAVLLDHTSNGKEDLFQKNLLSKTAITGKMYRFSGMRVQYDYLKKWTICYVNSIVFKDINPSHFILSCHWKLRTPDPFSQLLIDQRTKLSTYLKQGRKSCLLATCGVTIVTDLKQE